MTAPPLIRSRDLSRRFEVSKPWLDRLIRREGRLFVNAVDDVSFDIARGETFGLVGESGSGKSTIARMIVGLLAPTSGTVAFQTGVASRKPRLQMIFQDPYASLNPRWRVARIIGEPILTYRLLSDRASLSDRVATLLWQVGLSPDDAAKYPHEFSGGQRQRIAIARALSAEPEFVVCDEPTSALDVSVQAQILNLMRDLQDSLGLTYLFISHNLAVVRYMATTVAVMYLGRIVEQAPAHALFDKPRHPYTRMLLSSVPDFSRRGTGRAAVAGEIPNPIQPPSGCHFHPRCPLANSRCTAEQPRLIDGVACHAVEEGRLPPRDAREGAAIRGQTI